MHWDIVPTDHKLAGSKRAVSLLPSHKQIRYNSRQDLVQLRKTTVQEDSEVDALRIIIELPAIDCEPRGLGKWHGKTVCVDQTPQVILDPMLNRAPAPSASCKCVDFCESLQDKASVKVIYKIPLTIRRIVPGTVCILGRQERSSSFSSRLPGIAAPRVRSQPWSGEMHDRHSRL